MPIFRFMFDISSYFGLISFYEFKEFHGNPGIVNPMGFFEDFFLKRLEKFYDFFKDFSNREDDFQRYE